MTASDGISALSPLSTCTGFVVSSVHTALLTVLLACTRCVLILFCISKLWRISDSLYSRCLKKPEERKRGGLLCDFERKGDKGRMLARCIGAESTASRDDNDRVDGKDIEELQRLAREGMIWYDLKQSRSTEASLADLFLQRLDVAFYA